MEDESFKVLTTLPAFRIVAGVSSTANTVQLPESAQNPFIGVTQDTVRDTNTAIPVRTLGRSKLFMNQTVAAGQLVGADTSGRGIVFTLPNTTTSLSVASQYIGVLLGAESGTGTISEILVRPGYVRSSS